VRASLCGLALLPACAAGLIFTFNPARATGSFARTGVAARAQGERLDIRLRSFTPGASGRLTVEPSEGGGRLRLTALNLPDPQTFSRGASTYVVWASNEGRIIRLGELRRDERGNGGLAFERPAMFDRYSVIVTAEASAEVERPGAPVLSTRAGEAVAVYPSAANTSPSNDAATNPGVAPAPVAPPAPTPARSMRPRRLSNDFYGEVDDAIAAQGGGRVIELEGEQLAAHASGMARAATHTGNAYVRVNFRGVPLPSTVGAATYAMWAIIPDGRIIYMGSLPVTEDLNRAEIYVRTAGFGADTFSLFVTAERARPVPAPSDRRVLTPKNEKVIVK
jgi:hypothetical protein